MIHLTFDNGPHPEVTPRVLDTLDAHGIRASFFVLGKHLATPDGMALAREAKARGHRVANHSYTHEVPLGDDLGAGAVARELAGTHELVGPLMGDDAWFRPFGGGGKLGAHLLSPQAATWLQEHGYSVALWNSVPGDWLDADAWVQRALNDAASNAHTVVVLHDILPDAMRHLHRFIHTLTEQGHTFTDTFPAECVPLVRGVPQPGFDAFVNRPGESL